MGVGRVGVVVGGGGGGGAVGVALILIGDRREQEKPKIALHQHAQFD